MLQSIISVGCIGSRFYASQIERVEEGFSLLGCKIVDTYWDADLVYVNDAAHYDEVLNTGINLRGKLILNVQDLAPHLGDRFPLEKIYHSLKKANAITSISNFVHQDLKNRAGFDSKIIYQPIKPVKKQILKEKLPFRAMFVGRVNDFAKRCKIGADALSILGFDGREVVTVGGETPYYGGVYWGITTDEVLNQLYNSVDFVMFPSGNNEGLGLPMVEAMAAGTIPVICNDLVTRQEFLPSSIFPEYDNVNPNPISIANFIARFMQDDNFKEDFKQRLYNHYLNNWMEKLSGKGVANSIIEVYNTI